ncbi:MAG: YncE family protein [Hyphomicrobiales bacterium]|nr:YncE family protein [Hyphomicrobiales bacterium]
MTRIFPFATSIIAIALAFALPPVQASAHDHVSSEWANLLFIPNRDSDDVAVVDTRTDTLVARIPVGATPHQVTLAPALGKIAVTNSGDDTLSIVDLKRMQTTATLTLGNTPEHMQLHPEGEVVAVGNIEGGTISLVSLREETELHRITGLHEPHNMTFSPDGKSLYVGNLGANFVSVINVESAKLTEQIPVGSGRATASLDAHDEHQGIIDVTASPDGSLGFAAFGDGDTLGVFDLRTSERIASRPTGDLPWRAYPSANGAYMIVPNNGDRTVSIFEAGAPFEEVARVDGAEGMTGVNTSHDTAFVIARGGEEIIVIDLESLETVGSIALPGASPETGVLTPDGEKLYVALSGADAVAVIDVEQREISKHIENVGEGPWGAFLLNADNYCH